MPDDSIGPETADDTETAQDSPVRQGSAPDVVDQLRRLGDLHRDGVLTDDEFAAQKASLLAGDTGPPRKRRRPSRRIVLLLVALLLVAGAGAGYAVKVDRDADARERREQAEARERAEDRRERARIAAEKAEAEEQELAEFTEEIEVDGRRDLVQALRKSVTADFRKRVSEGVLEGPILGTSCVPVSGGIEDLDEATGKFECLVATERTGDSGRRGYGVDATINYTQGSYTWQLDLDP